MAEYADLTPYEYLPLEEREERAPLVNVGWLGTGLPHPTGEVPPGFVDALIVLADDMRHSTRGFHGCPFCLAESPVRVRSERLARPVPLGMAEIHVPGPDGVVYAAPTLVIHYITDHGYRPPQEFIDAVLAAPHPEDGPAPTTDH